MGRLPANRDGPAMFHVQMPRMSECWLHPLQFYVNEYPGNQEYTCLNPFKNPSKSPINIRSEEHITQTCVCVSISANVLKGDILKALIRGPFLSGFRVEGLRF